MKTRVLHKILPLVLLAFLNVISSYGHTIEPLITGLDRDSDLVQQSNNTRAIFFEEVQATYSYFELKRNPVYSNGIHERFSAKLSDAQQPSAKGNISPYLQDIRKLLEHQIFPFHFYW